MIISGVGTLYDKITEIFIGALILFAALAWRDAFNLYSYKHPEMKKRGPWIYSAFVTIIAILVIALLLFPLRYLVVGEIFTK